MFGSKQGFSWSADRMAIFQVKSKMAADGHLGMTATAQPLRQLGFFVYMYHCYIA